MPRATSAVARNKRKKKIFKAAKGYFGGRKNLYRTAKDAVESVRVAREEVGLADQGAWADLIRRMLDVYERVGEAR